MAEEKLLEEEEEGGISDDNAPLLSDRRGSSVSDAEGWSEDIVSWCILAADNPSSSWWMELSRCFIDQFKFVMKHSNTMELTNRQGPKYGQSTVI